MRSAVDIENVRQIIRDVPVVEMRQLILFFHEEIPANTVEFYVKWLAQLGEVQYEEESGLIKWHHAPMMQSRYVHYFLRSFWIVAYFGSKAVDAVHAMRFPFTYEIILNLETGAETYDIAICNNSNDAHTAAKELQRMQISGVPDETVHLLLVPDKRIGESMRAYGFDSYVTLKKQTDPNLSLRIEIPKFESWDSENE